LGFIWIGRKSGPGRRRDWGDDNYERRGRVRRERKERGLREDGRSIGTGEGSRAEMVLGTD